MKNPVPYLLMLLALPLLHSGCRKSSPTEDHTSMLGGTRIWHGHKTGSNLVYGKTYNFDTSYTDTFALTIVDKNTVEVDVDRIYFVGYNSQTGVSTFQTMNGSSAPYSQVLYYSRGDSIVYNTSFNHASGWYSITLSTP